MSAWLPSLLNQSVHPAKCGANCFWDKNAEKCLARGLRGEGGGRGMHPLLPHGYFIFGSDVKLCLETVTDSDQLQVVSRWSGCFMPKIKCRASILANN